MYRQNIFTVLLYIEIICSKAINTVTIKNKQNISFEFRICHFCTILFIVFSFWRHDVKMEWDDKKKRIAVIALHKVRMDPIIIFKILHYLILVKCLCTGLLTDTMKPSLFVTVQNLAAVFF